MLLLSATDCIKQACPLKITKLNITIVRKEVKRIKSSARVFVGFIFVIYLRKCINTPKHQVAVVRRPAGRQPPRSHRRRKAAATGCPQVCTGDPHLATIRLKRSRGRTKSYVPKIKVHTMVEENTPQKVLSCLQTVSKSAFPAAMYWSSLIACSVLDFLSFFFLN